MKEIERKSLTQKTKTLFQLKSVQSFSKQKFHLSSEFTGQNSKSLSYS